MRIGLLTGCRPTKNRGPTRGVNILTDGDCEAADVSAWTASDATLTKSTTNVKQGVRCLSIVSSTASKGYASNGSVTAGVTYRVTGWARGDGGSGYPRIQVPGAVGQVWQGTTSASWQSFDATFTPDVNTVIRWYQYANILNAGSCFDDIYLSVG